MKLHSLRARHFGIHDDLELSFQPGLQVVYGPNEVGKTTLLGLIRSLFFKIPSRNHAYTFGSATPELEAVGELQDGRQLKFRRTTASKRPLTGELFAAGVEIDRGGLAAYGQPIEEQAFFELLGGISDTHYQRLFAFSEVELKDLEVAKDEPDFGRLLFGSGIGGLAGFQEFERTLQSRLDALFKASGRKPRLNQCLSAVKEAEKAYMELRVPPNRYRELQETLSKLKEDRTGIRASLEELRAKRIELEKLLSARPLWEVLDLREQQRRDISLPEGGTVEVVRHYQVLVSRRDELEGRQRAEERERDAIPELEAASDAENRLLERRAEVLQQFSFRERLRADIASIPELEEVIQSRQRLVAGASAELEPFGRGSTEGGGDSPSRTVTARERNLGRELRERFEEIDREETGLRSELKSIEQRISDAERKLGRLKPDVEQEMIEDLSHRLESYQEAVRELERTETAIQRGEIETASLLDGLRRPLSLGNEIVAQLPTPLADTVVAFEKRMEQTVDRLRQRQSTWEDRSEECESRREMLANLERSESGDLRSELLAVRLRRDGGWSLLRQRFIDSVSEEAVERVDRELQAWMDGVAGDAADEFERLLAKGDSAADAQLTHAESIANWNALVEQVRQAEEKVATSAREVAEAERQLEEVEKEWNDLWQGCPFEPKDPAAMREWLKQRDEYIKQQNELAVLNAQRDKLRPRVVTFESELEQMFSEGSSAESRVKLLKKRIKKAEQGEAERERLSIEIEDLRREQDRATEQVLAVEKKRGECQLQLLELLREVGLKESLDVRVCDNLLEQLQTQQRCQQELQEYVGRLDLTRERIEKIQKEVWACCEHVAPELVGVECGTAIDELQRRLEAAETQLRTRETDEVQRKAIERRLERLRRESQEVESGLNELCATVSGSASLERLEMVVEQIQLDETLAEEVKQLGRDIGHKLNAELSVYEEQLRRFTVAELSAQLDEVDQEIRVVQEVEQKQEQSIGAKELELNELAHDERASVAAQKLMSARAELKEVVHQWGPLVMTQGLVARSMKRFEENHQPALLKGVASLFRQLTGGEYLDIRTLPSEANSLRLRHRSGTDKSPDELSTGAQRLLFLAIRLAYVEDYCQRHEPLPMVLDDVLVHLDDERSMQALQALREFGATTQVILLSCHDRTCTQMAEIDPGFEAIELNRVSKPRARRGAEV